MPGQVQPLNDKEFIQQLAQQAETQEGGGMTAEQLIQAKKQQLAMQEKMAAKKKVDALEQEFHTGYNAPTAAKKKGYYPKDIDEKMPYGYAQAAAPRKSAVRQPTIEQEMERIFATTEPMMEISARIMELKADDGVGQKLGRATASYCGQMMEYFQDEGFSREESMQLLSSMIRNNSVITGG